MPPIKHNQHTKNSKLLIGWEEWCALPELGLPAIKAKVDTGARTSALHAFDIQLFKSEGETFVRFHIYPLQQNKDIKRSCIAKLVDHRFVTSSSGYQEKRYVIKTPIQLGGIKWDIEITLTNREPLRFRMLLGRTAIKGRVLIDPGKSLYLGRYTQDELDAMYTAL